MTAAIVHKVKVLTTESTHAVSEGNVFARESEELDNQRCSAETSFGQLDHPWIWLECVNLVDACRVVMVKVRPQTPRRSPARSPAPQATVVGDTRGLVPGRRVRSRVADKSGLGRAPWSGTSTLLIR